MLEERIENIKSELEQFQDSFSKYAFLVELSAYVSPNQPDLMTEENLYNGCQSKVWIKMENKNKLFLMSATSDTLIIRGILYIMMELFNGCITKEISESEIDFLKSCGIEEHFSSERTIGIEGITKAVFDYCANH